MNKGKICVSVCAETADELIEQIKRAEDLADVIEIRFDCLKESEFDSALQHISNLSINKPLLATFRPKDKYADLTPVKKIYKNDEERKLHQIKANYRFKGWEGILDIKNVEYVDFEYDIHSYLRWNMMFVNGLTSELDAKSEIDLAAKLKERKLISSEHFFEYVSNLEETFEKLSSKIEIDGDEPKEFTNINPAVIKIASQANEITDTIAVWKLLEKAKSENKQIIPIAMGEAGKWTRILGLAHGAFLTYASFHAGTETAPGQVSAKDLIEVYRAKELNEQTEVYGIIGNPVSHSMSPYIHNALFKSHNLNAVFVPLEVKNLDEFIKSFVDEKTCEVKLNFRGFSVTIPHKQAIIKFLDSIDETAKAIGAVNTVKISDGKLYGFNTDAPGFIEPLLNSYGDLRGAKVAVLGNGGAARACVYALKTEGANVCVFARNTEKAKDLSNEFQVELREFPKTENRKPKTDFRDFDVLVNSTPLGMRGKFENETPVFAEQMENLKLVYDLVYNPFETRLIKEAREASVPTIGGLAMFVAQAARQFKIWTGKDAPLKEMSQIAIRRLQT